MFMIVPEGPKGLKRENIGGPWGSRKKNQKSFFDLGFAENSSSYVEKHVFLPPEVAYDPSVDPGNIPPRLKKQGLAGFEDTRTSQFCALE